MIQSSLVLAAVLASGTVWAQDNSRPDSTMTPGAVATVDLEVICRHGTKERRRVSTARCDAVFRAYSIPNTPVDRYSYECDHLVPLALGGANNAANLWPQPNAEAEIKDRCEKRLHDRVCSAYRTLAPAEAAEVLQQDQRAIAESWVAACGAGGR